MLLPLRMAHIYSLQALLRSPHSMWFLPKSLQPLFAPTLCATVSPAQVASGVRVLWGQVRPLFQ